MLGQTKTEYTQLEDGRWKAHLKLSMLGDHITFGDTKQEAEQKLKRSCKRHKYSITKQADSYHG